MQAQLLHSDKPALSRSAVALLKELIRTPSYSREEDSTASLISSFLDEQGILWHRKFNNIWAFNKYYDPSLPTVLLNSHHDTVKPNAGYTRDPFIPYEHEGKLYGLGSNDAGGALVSLLTAFLHFYGRTDLRYNLLFAATAEEEISGANGIGSILRYVGVLDFAIVGEPTGMQMAVAQKGLMVLDCRVKGVSAHVAHDAGDNAIYKALPDLNWFRSYSFPRISEWLGKVKMTVTAIKAGDQHNIVPAQCHFTVDVRTTDAYSNEQVLRIIKDHVQAEVIARSLRLQPSSISPRHPVVLAGLSEGLKMYGSPTLSDSALLPVPALKIGPGDSTRSHTADEFIYLHEITQGMEMYIKLLDHVICDKS